MVELNSVPSNTVEHKSDHMLQINIDRGTVSGVFHSLRESAAMSSDRSDDLIGYVPALGAPGPMTAPRILYPGLIDRAAVANMLGISLQRLYRCMGRLRANRRNPFPPPTLGRGSGARWSAEEIWRWIAAGGENAVERPDGEAGPEGDEWASHLDAKAIGLPRRRKPRSSR